ncbi:MAG: FmdB family zinc ribbon protein [Desulfobaccales bacterium]
MPIYEYQCSACGQVLEKWQKFSEEPLKSCPACGGPLHKLISSCAFHLKGSGWYATDYSGSRNAASAGNASEGAKEAAASGEPAQPKEASKEAESAPKPEIAASAKKIK